MKRHRFHRGVAAVKLILFSIVMSSLALITTSACPAKLRSNHIVSKPMKHMTFTQHAIEVNGLKDDTAEIFDKMMDFFSYYSNNPPPPARRVFGSSSRTIKHTRSGSTKKGEQFTVHQVTGDGRCMFRALVKGMAFNEGGALDYDEERDQADELKAEIKKFICDSDSEHQEFDDAILAITIEVPLESYCERIMQSNFWGGEAELLILSKLLSLPVTVYIPSQENTMKVDNTYDFVEISKYKPEFKNGTTRGEVKKDVRLLYSDNSHYNLLL